MWGRPSADTSPASWRVSSASTAGGDTEKGCSPTSTCPECADWTEIQWVRFGTKKEKATKMPKDSSISLSAGSPDDSADRSACSSSPTQRRGRGPVASEDPMWGRPSADTSPASWPVSSASTAGGDTEKGSSSSSDPATWVKPRTPFRSPVREEKRRDFPPTVLDVSAGRRAPSPSSLSSSSSSDSSSSSSSEDEDRNLNKRKREKSRRKNKPRSCSRHGRKQSKSSKKKVKRSSEDVGTPMTDAFVPTGQPVPLAGPSGIVFPTVTAYSRMEELVTEDLMEGGECSTDDISSYRKVLALI
ncbi:osteocalcin 2-like [Palaemon carinicauda]|uniref:osteocalcin 2-like n=1 Tax=Palaemon carinicauda TaxID=392227 RepID=UPI0035B65A23